MYYQHVVTGTQKTVHLWDVDQAQPWAERITTTVNGVIGRIETIYGDHKTVEVRDLTGTEEWTKHIQEWRGPNFKNKVENKHYDGNKLINKLTWDFNGEDWESEEKRYDDGTVHYHKIVNDDSLTIVTETDTNGSDNWETKITKSREFTSTMKTFAVITKYDSAPTESGITFDEFVKLTDHKGVEIWFENHIRANNGTPVFGYITDENGNGMSVTYLPGNLEKARAWEGLDPVF
ncbi:hypothetical protein KBI52_19940 [Microvirga sp. HBU67558]|uniref:hypothetical protein n=1 Tax=Microvirga TaxID=186650 RepID=UPI001B35E55F|nr:MULTISPECIES: hypothetical protein [unclassified Microvirga]MBQ0822467.1 hypothetical protein [Microvirga sp. HBU67558]